MACVVARTSASIVPMSRLAHASLIRSVCVSIVVALACLTHVAYSVVFVAAMVARALVVLACLTLARYVDVCVFADGSQ